MKEMGHFLCLLRPISVAWCHEPFSLTEMQRAVLVAVEAGCSRDGESQATRALTPRTI